MPFLPEPLPAGQVDEVVSAGVPGDVFEPRRTTHGFRYVRIEGHPGDAHRRRRHAASSCTPTCAAPAGSPAATSGSTGCTRRRCGASADNACDIPTDCPHRERAGWTGDWQLYVPTAAFLYDVAGFSAKWLRDVAADQWPDGTVANISPDAARPRGPGQPGRLPQRLGRLGRRRVIVPWELYRAYGDAQVARRAVADDGRAGWTAPSGWPATSGTPTGSARRPEPAPHEQYLWDTGFHWGEWLEPGEDLGDFGAFVAADKGDVATAYFAHSAGLMARIAAAARPGRRRRPLRRAGRTTCAPPGRPSTSTPTAGSTPDTQANHVRALAFDLVPDRAAAGGRPTGWSS